MVKLIQVIDDYYKKVKEFKNIREEYSRDDYTGGDLEE